MNILHVIPSLSPEGGGPPKIALCIAAGQAQLGHRATMVAYRFPASQANTDKELAGIPGIANVNLDYLPPLTKFERFFARGAFAHFKKILPAYDFVHIHAMWDPICKAAADACQQAKKPYTILLNGMLDPWSMSQAKLKKQIALALGYRRMINRAAFLHAGNADEKKLIEPLNLTPPVEIIPNGIFLDEIPSPLPKGSFYAKHPELEGNPFVLFLSRLHYKKGLDYLADAFAIVAKQNGDVKLVVAGPDGGERAPFEKRIADHGIASRVHLVGPLYAADKYAALSDATCFCLPSRQEGFSVAILEALACGVPVSISEGCHFPEVAEAGAGFVDPLEPQAIANSILKILSDASLRASMSAAGRNLIESRYTWPKVAQMTIDAYQKHVAKTLK